MLEYQAVNLLLPIYMYTIKFFNLEPSTVSDTQRRACLTFGAIIKNLRTNGNTTLALRLANKLEEILGHHNECKLVTTLEFLLK